MRRLPLALCLLFLLILPSYAADTTIFSDAFSGTNGTDLNAHTPNIGTSWTKAEDTAGTNKLAITSSTVTMGASANTNSQRLTYAAVPASSTADMASDIKITTLATNNSAFVDDTIYLEVRYQDASNFYYCLIYGANSTASPTHIGKKVSGTASSLANTTDTLVANDIFRCEVVGSTLTLYKNGSSILSTTDTTISGAGNGGVGMGNVQTSTDDYHTQWKLDDFHVYEISSPSTRRRW